mgnify:CR=1 FL=1
MAFSVAEGVKIPPSLRNIRKELARDLGLTTIRQTPVEMAREAARMTLALIEKQPLDEPFKTFPAQLIVRSTTARLHS